MNKNAQSPSEKMAKKSVFANRITGKKELTAVFFLMIMVLLRRGGSMSVQPVIKQPIIQRYNGEANSPFHILPKEIVKLIFQKIMAVQLRETFQEWKNCALVCKRWAHIVQELRQETLETMAKVLTQEAKEMWESYFGEIGEAPDLPIEAVKAWYSPCPFWPNRKVRETHMLALIPRTVNGKPLTLEYLDQLVHNPKQGNKTQYSYFNSYDYGKTPVGESHWVLMTREVLSDSRSEDYSDQLKLIKKYNQTNGVTYEAPRLLDTAVCVFLEYVRSGTRLYSDNPWTYTRCQEKSSWGQMVVGGFSLAGLSLYDDSDYGNDRYGISVFRKF